MKSAAIHKNKVCFLSHPASVGVAIREERKRRVRRMTGMVGHPVLRLKRISSTGGSLAI